MPRAQRLLFLGIAVAIAIAAAVVLGASGGDDGAADRASAGREATATATPDSGGTPAETPTATPTREPTPEPPPLVTGGEVTKLRFRQGQTVRFRVRVDAPDEVHVHTYDVVKDVEPGRTVTVAFPAEITGIFEVELHGSGEQIAQLRVDPK